MRRKLQKIDLDQMEQPVYKGIVFASERVEKSDGNL